MNEGENIEKGTRRDFLFKLGGLTGMVLCGWSAGAAQGASGSVAALAAGASPAIRSDLRVVETEFGAEFFDRSGAGPGRPLCAVNKAGLRVIRLLDGKNTVEGVAADLLSHDGAGPSNLGAFTAGVALFMAHLGSVGLLDGPFYVDIVSREVSA